MRNKVESAEARTVITGRSPFHSKGGGGKKELPNLGFRKKLFMAGVAFLVLLVMFFTSTLKGQLTKKLQVEAQLMMDPGAYQIATKSHKEPYPEPNRVNTIQIVPKGDDKYAVTLILKTPEEAEGISSGENGPRITGLGDPITFERPPFHQWADGVAVYEIEIDRESVEKYQLLGRPDTELKLLFDKILQGGKQTQSEFRPLMLGDNPLTRDKVLERMALTSFLQAGLGEGQNLRVSDIPTYRDDKIEDCKKIFPLNEEKWTSSKVEDVICSFLIGFGELFERFANWATDGLFNFITNVINYWQEALSGWVKSVWQSVRTFVDILAIIALIIIAFATILRLNINIYGIKRALPVAVVAIIFANLSYTLGSWLIRAASSLALLLLEPAQEGIRNLNGSLAMLAPLVLVAFFNPGLGCIAALIVFIGLIALVILGFIAVAQPIVVGALIAFAPLAIMAAIFPFTESFFKKWLTYFFNWVFMIPVIFFILYLIGIVGQAGDPDAIKAIMGGTDIKGDANLLTALVSLGVRIILLYIAVRIPFKMGGDIAAAWGKVGKFAGSWGWRKLQIGGTALVTQARTIKEQAERRAKLPGGEGIKRGEKIAAFWRQRLGEAIMSYNPESVIAGYRERAESEAAGIKGMRQVTSRAYQKIVGPGVIFDLNYEGELEKATDRSDEENRAVLEDYMRKFGLDKVAILIALRNTKAKISGLIKSGAFLKGVEDPEKFATTVKALFSQAGRTTMGQLMWPSGTEFVGGLGLARELPAPALAGWLAEAEKGTREYDRRLESIRESLQTQLPDAEELIKQGVAPEEAKERAKEASKRLARRVERLEALAGYWRGRGGRGSGYGEETPPMATGEEANQARAEREGLGAIQAFLTGGALPVRIVQDGNLLVADRLAEATLQRNTFQLRRQAETLGETEEGQQELGRLIEQTWLNPREIFTGLGAGTIGTGLHSDVRSGLLGLAGQASRREELLNRTARARAEARVTETAPYMASLSQQIRNRRVNPNDLPAIDKRIQETLEAIEKGKVSPGALTQLRNDLRLIVPSPTLNLPTLSQAALYQAGQRARGVIAQFSSPEVRKIVETGASAGQVQETLLRAETSRQLRSHALHRLQANLTPLRREGTSETELSADIANRVASFMRNSPQVSPQLVRLPGERQVEIARQVAQSLISETKAREKPLDESVLNQRVAEAIRGAVGGAPSGAPAPGTPPAAGTPPPPPAGSPTGEAGGAPPP